MTLVELIRKRGLGNRAVATATLATDEPHVQPTGAVVATVAGARRQIENHERTLSRPAVVIEPASPTPPLAPGWLVVYRDQEWVLCGGYDDRQHGTVQECRWGTKGWTVHLTDGQQLPLVSIQSVRKENRTGEPIAAWTVRAHGYDGRKGDPSPVVDAASPARRTSGEALPDTRAAER